MLKAITKLSFRQKIYLLGFETDGKALVAVSQRSPSGRANSSIFKLIFRRQQSPRRSTRLTPDPATDPQPANRNTPQ